MKDRVIIDSGERQFKGNIHMHTVRSDGKLTPKEAAEKYRNAGYDFIMISDHEIYWNSSCLDREDFLVLGGTETSILMNTDYRWILDYDLRGGKNPRNQHTYMHYNCILDENQEDRGQFFRQDERVPQMLDRGIDSWNQQVEFMEKKGNLVIVNHPHWSRLEPAMLLACKNITAFEVWNSGDVYKCGGRPDEEIWDYCLTRGKRLLAVAADDSHEYTTDFGAGFTMVQCQDFSKTAITKAFKKGKFYASCGPLVHDMRIEEGVLKMRFTPARHVKIVGYDCDGYNKCMEDGSLFESLEWKINTKMRYFRPVIIDEYGRTAWLQPIFPEDILE